jgi:hypothetical protein
MIQNPMESLKNPIKEDKIQMILKESFVEKND